MEFYGNLFIGGSGINLYDPYTVAPGQSLYTSAGSYSWVAPANVTSVSVVCVGAGGGAGMYGGGGGGGGALAFKNNISVTPGNTYTIVVGARGQANYVSGGSGIAATRGGNTSAFGAIAGGGSAGNSGSPNHPTNVSGIASAGGLPFGIYDVGWPGGRGGSRTWGGAGGGAGGYAGRGGNANVYVHPFLPGVNVQDEPGAAGTAGEGGGGGAGFGTYGSSVQKTNISIDLPSGHGGGTGLYGIGANGAAGTGTLVDKHGKGGSGGGNGSDDPYQEGLYRGEGGSPGGGGGGNMGSGSNSATSTNGLNGRGAPGGVRIIWPGVIRKFPDIRTADE